MNLYRLRGRAELWPDTGLVYIIPVVTGSASLLTISVKKFIKTLKKEKKKYKLVTEKLTVKTPSKEEWIKALSTGITDDLIFGSKEIKKWEG